MRRNQRIACISQAKPSNGYTIVLKSWLYGGRRMEVESGTVLEAICI